MAAALTATAALAAGLAGLVSGSASAAPGDPGVPSAPVEIFHEDFENVGDGQVALITDYVRAVDGGGYTAEELWTDPDQCNGIVLDFTSTGWPGCAFNGPIRALAQDLGEINGSADANLNHAVSAYTHNANSSSGAIEFRTDEPLALEVQDRFLTFSVNVAAISCGGTNRTPELQFFLDDGTQELPVTNAPITPCDGGNGAAQHFSDGSMLFSGSELGVVMRNVEGRSSGNDHAFDDIRVFDATPQLDKAFEPADQTAGLPSTLTFTVTNTSELAAKAGWSFTDNLPAGMVVADDPNTSTDCTNGAVTAAAGGSAVGFAGDLASGVVSCTLSVDVVAPAGGTFTNGPDNLSDVVGLNQPTSTSVTFEPPLDVHVCEDGLALLNEPGLDADRTYVLLSGGVHKGTEDFTRALVDPLTVPLLGLDATELVHQVNCEIVEPVEDLVDAITVPLIQNLGLKGALRGLFG